MQHSLLVVLVVTLSFALAFAEYPIFNPNPVSWPDDDSAAFKLFMITFNKTYPTLAEQNNRFAIFQANVQRAKILDAGSLRQGKLSNMTNSAARFGITKFSDLTPEEFRQAYLGSKVDTILSADIKVWDRQVVDPNAPAARDCRDGTLFDYNVCKLVTPVYNQGQCGSCWAFSVTEQLESMWAIYHDTLHHLSMQQVVSCDHTCYGCDGGYTSRAWDYIHSAGGLDSYSSYPYTASNGHCDFHEKDVQAKIKEWVYVTKDENELSMHDYLTKSGPMSICVDAETWQYYHGGVILKGTCGTALDHCVQITGIDTSVDHHVAWRVRNSWGTDWGLSGYLWVEYGHNVCGIATTVTSAVPAA